MGKGCALVVGGTAGLGLEVARHYHDGGKPVVITGRDPERAAAAAAGIGKGVIGLGFDLSQPEGIAAALADVGPVSRLVLAAIARDNNPVRSYDIAAAISLDDHETRRVPRRSTSSTGSPTTRPWSCSGDVPRTALTRDRPR
jgi:NAD(P)-dependent dehydrogenase (short-subunit alcohol dehydrogenase family)